MGILVLLEAETFLDSKATVNCEEEQNSTEFDRLVSLNETAILSGASVM